MRIIPIASGKGGVGKSLIAANLGVACAQAGRRVVLADLDLGASNLHLVLGHAAPRSGISGWIANTRVDFHRVITDTDIPGLRFIPGDTEIPGAANLRPAQLNALVRRLLALEDEADILFLDLGAGTHQAILDFFLLSGQGIVVSAPAVTAVLNAYVFLKNAVFRLMYTTFGKGTPARAWLDQARKDSAGPQRLYLPRLLPEIRERDSASYDAFMTRLDRFHPRLIMNMIADPQDAEVASKIRHSCEEYLSLKIEHLGVVYRDSVQDTALASRLPVVLYKPQSLLSQAVYRIAGKILSSPEDDFVPRERGREQEIEDSFQEAGQEAELDFENRLDYVEELLHSGTLSTGDLIETVKSQQLELSKVRKENAFLKLKLSQAVAKGFRL